MEKQQQFSLWYFLVAFLAIMAIQNFLFAPHPENLAYNEFKALLKAGKLANIALGERAISGAQARGLGLQRLRSLRAGEGETLRDGARGRSDPGRNRRSQGALRHRSKVVLDCCPGSRQGHSSRSGSINA